MRIAIDIQALQTRGSKKRGIGRYTQSVLEALLTENVSHGYQLYANATLEAPGLDISSCPYINIDYPHIGSSDINDLLFKTLIQANNFEAIFLPSPMEELEANIPDYKIFSKKLFVICYDLIPLIFADRYLNDPNARSLYMRRLKNVQNADFIFAISESTRQDAIKYLNIHPDNILNISGGVSSFFTPIDRGEHVVWLEKFKDKFNIYKNFILYTGGEDWRKNIEGLVKAFAKLPKTLRDTHQLVIACKVSEFFVKEITALASKLGVNESLVLTNYVTDEELRAFYSTCSLFAFPSYYEGFGLPLLEAISCGAPAIASNNSSLIEIVNTPEQLFDANSIDNIAKVMQEVLANEQLRINLSETSLQQATKFSWTSVAQKISDVFSEQQPITKVNIIFNRVQNNLSKPSIAFFSPFSPLKSGISDYSQDLLPSLSKHFSIDLFHDESYSPDSNASGNMFPHTQFESRLKNYDYEGLIYQIGNSSYHSYMYHLLIRYPGISVLHDYYLGGLINYTDSHCPKLGIKLAHELEHSYGKEKSSEILSQLQNGQMNIHEKLSEAGIYVNRRIFTRSLGVILHSKWAYNQAIKSFGEDNECIVHIPQLVPKYQKNESLTNNFSNDYRDKFGIPTNSFVISSFGFLSSTKRPLQILHAFKLYISYQPDAYLVFVGGTDYLGTTDIESEINKLGLQNKVKVTGFVNMTDFYRYIEVSDICLNLRYPFNGESSASLLRILSVGKPVVVTDVGSFSDFPNDVVFKIPKPIECDEIAEILKALTTITEISDYRKSLAENALEYVSRENSPERCTRLYADFFEKVQSSPQTIQKLLADYVGREIAKYEISNPQSLLQKFSNLIASAK